MRFETKSAIAFTAKRDVLRFAVMFLGCTTLLASYHAIVARYGDVSDYYTLASSEGPFAATVDGKGTVVRGADTGTFRPGELVGWVSVACLEPGVVASGTTTMVRPRQDGLPEIVVATRTTHLDPHSIRCGPRDYALRVPDDAVPGSYELRRTLTVREGSAWPLNARYPSMLFRVAVPSSVPDEPAQ